MQNGSMISQFPLEHRKMVLLCGHFRLVQPSFNYELSGDVWLVTIHAIRLLKGLQVYTR
jgi:hypothetical protein